MREAIKQTLIAHGVSDISGALLDELADCCAKTREACAKVADDFEYQENGRAYDKRQEGRDDNFNCARASAAKHIATAIRKGADT